MKWLTCRAACLRKISPSFFKMQQAISSKLTLGLQQAARCLLINIRHYMRVISVDSNKTQIYPVQMCHSKHRHEWVIFNLHKIFNMTYLCLATLLQLSFIPLKTWICFFTSRKKITLFTLQHLFLHTSAHNSFLP